MTTGSESDVGNAIVRKDLGLWLQQWPGFNTTTTNAAAPGPVKVPSTSAGSATSSWSNTPAHSASDMVVTVSFKNWLRRPDLVYASPDHPQPLELLYGSKTKFVADTLHHSPRSWPCRDPWASGYGVAHVLSDQMDANRPIPENYARLQEFQIPVGEQLEHSHPYFIDFVHWPKLRANVIRHGGDGERSGYPGHVPLLCKASLAVGTKVPGTEAGWHFEDAKGFCRHVHEFGRLGCDGWFLPRIPALGEGMDPDKTIYHNWLIETTSPAVTFRLARARVDETYLPMCASSAPVPAVAPVRRDTVHRQSTILFLSMTSATSDNSSRYIVRSLPTVPFVTRVDNETSVP